MGVPRFHIRIVCCTNLPYFSVAFLVMKANCSAQTCIMLLLTNVNSFVA